MVWEHTKIWSMRFRLNGTWITQGGPSCSNSKVRDKNLHDFGLVWFSWVWVRWRNPEFLCLRKPGQKAPLKWHWQSAKRRSNQRSRRGPRRWYLKPSRTRATQSRRSHAPLRSTSSPLLSPSSPPSPSSVPMPTPLSTPLPVQAPNSLGFPPPRRPPAPAASPGAARIRWKWRVGAWRARKQRAWVGESGERGMESASVMWAVSVGGGEREQPSITKQETTNDFVCSVVLWITLNFSSAFSIRVNPNPFLLWVALCGNNSECYQIMILTWTWYSYRLKML